MKVLRIIAALCVLAPASLAFASEPIHVVKFINFSCGVCRSAETLDPPIRTQVEAQGGRFVIAPLPRGRNEARERFYYALRDLGPAVEAQTRQSLFRGAQDMNYPLNDVPQTLDWLQMDLKNDQIDWSRLISTVNGTEPAAAVERAVQLAIRAGLQVVPTYVLVQGDRVLATMDPKSVPGGELTSLRESVLQALRKNQSAP